MERTGKTDAVDIGSDPLASIKALVADNLPQEGAVEVQEVVVGLGGRAAAREDADRECEDGLSCKSPWGHPPPRDERTEVAHEKPRVGEPRRPELCGECHWRMSAGAPSWNMGSERNLQCQVLESKRTTMLLVKTRDPRSRDDVALVPYMLTRPKLARSLGHSRVHPLNPAYLPSLNLTAHDPRQDDLSQGCALSARPRHSAPVSLRRWLDATTL